MKSSLHNKGTRALALIAALSLTASVAPAQRRARKDQAQEPARYVEPKMLNDAASRASRASRVVSRTMSIPARAIPQELLDRAAAVAVFPGVFRAAFGVGGRGGKGVISRRLPDGTWTAPVYFTMGGGSFGAQIGASSTDFVLLIMNDNGIDGLLTDKFTLGTDASIAAGPVGRTAQAATNLTLDAGILSYSRSRGLFAGVALNGVVINPDNDINEALYGMTARDVLTGLQAQTVRADQAPAKVRVFPQTLARYSSRPASQAATNDGTQ